MTIADSPALHVRLITLAFRPALGAFDTTPLDQFLAGKELLALREYLLDAQGAPHLLCVLTYRDAVPTPPRDLVSATTCTPLRTRQARPAPHDLTPPETERFARLRAWRSRRARQDGVPPYILFHDRELADLARKNPASLTALAEVKGVGSNKLSRFGEEVLAALVAETPHPHDATPAAKDAPA